MFLRLRKSLFHKAGQPEANLRNVSDQQQVHQAADHVLQQMPVDQLAHLCLPQSRRHIEIDAQRRGDHADAHIQQHDDTEMDRINVVGRERREQDGSNDQDGRRGIHEAAHDQQQHVHQQQEHDLVGADAHDELSRMGRDLLTGHQQAEHAGAGHDEHDHTGGGSRGFYRFHQALEVNFPIDEAAHDQAVRAGNGRRLSRRKNTGVDTAQDDNGHEDGANGMVGRRQKFSDIKLGSGDPIFHTVENRKSDHQRAQRDAGNNAGHEHTAHGNACCRAVCDHHGTGRNNGAQHTGRCDGGQGEFAVIASLFQCRHHHRADGRHRCRGGAAQAAKQHAGENRHDAETAGHPAHQLLGEVNDSF